MSFLYKTIIAPLGTHSVFAFCEWMIGLLSWSWLHRPGPKFFRSLRMEYQKFKPCLGCRDFKAARWLRETLSWSKVKWGLGMKFSSRVLAWYVHYAGFLRGRGALERDTVVTWSTISVTNTHFFMMLFFFSYSDTVRLRWKQYHKYYGSKSNWNESNECDKFDEIQIWQ